jgi:hypothetical protein
MATQDKKETVTTHVVDFTNVKDGGASFNKKRVPAGDYLAKVTKVQDAPSKADGIHQWLYTVELQQAHTDRKFPYYCKLQENQLWKLRNLFLAAGIVVPKKKVRVDPSKIINKLIGVTLEDDEYDGKMQSNIAAVFPASELEDSDTDEDTEDTEEEEEEEEDTDDGEEEEDEEEEEEPEPAPKKVAAKKAAPAKKAVGKKKPAPVEDDEMEELDLDDL